MLTIDDFTTGCFNITLQPGESDTNIQCPPDRQTIFTNSANYQSGNMWNQPSTLDIRKGIFIVNSGFGADTSGQVRYGRQQGPTATPLGLNTSGYSGLQLSFAGMSANIELSVFMVVQLPNGQQYDCGPVKAQPIGNAFSLDFPWTGFNAGGSLLPQPSDIDGISILWESITTATFGITSVQAVP